MSKEVSSVSRLWHFLGWLGLPIVASQLIGGEPAWACVNLLASWSLLDAGARLVKP